MAANPKYIQPAGQPVTLPPAVPSEPIWRLSVRQYHWMTRAGMFTDDDPVELLEGWLVSKMPKNPPHRTITKRIYDSIARLLPVGWYVDSQEPITTRDSEPEPDVTIVRGDSEQYFDRHPGPEDLALVVEVADTTVHRDRTLKKRIYARAGISCYWIINLPEKQIEVYTSPSGSGSQPDYQQRQDYFPTDDLPLVLDGQEIGRLAVRSLLP
ncbi:MAG: Uma2 family endonuclease [Blastocatellia bacterium]